MAKRKAKAKAKAPSTLALLSKALTTADNCCIALDTAYADFSEFEVFNKKAVSRALKAANKVVAQLEAF